MTRSVYEIWLTQGKEKIRIPVLPEKIEISNPSSNETINVAGLGEATIIQDPALKTFSFSSFFPAKTSNKTPIVEYKNYPKPWDIVKKIEKWKASEKPIRLIVTKTPINYAVTIEDFPYSEGDLDIGDISYDLQLKRFEYIKVRKINTKKKSSKKKQRPDTRSKPKNHKVKKGDTLWGIARTYYKDSTEWRKIWNANKTMLIKRDKRNIKQPGHWIYPGQVLKIP